MPTTVVNTFGDGGDYSTWKLALDGEEHSLSAADEVQVLRAVGLVSSGADTTAIPPTSIGTDWGTDATRYLVCEADTSNEAHSQWDTTRYHLQCSLGSSQCVSPDAQYLQIIGLQINAITLSGYSQPIASPGNARGSWLFDRCFLRNDGTGSGVYAHNTQVKLRNTIIVGCAYAFYSSGQTTGDEFYSHSNTVVGCANGFRVASTSLSHVRNTGFSSVTTQYPNGTPSTNANNSTSTPTFVDAGALDYGLASGDVTWAGGGADLSADSNLPVAVDIEGTARPGSPAIGAVEPAAGGGSEVDPGIGAETDTALATTLAKQLATALASEADSAQALALARHVAAGRSTETDVALAGQLTKTVAAGLSSSADTAHGPLVTKPLGTEADVALAPAALARLLPTGVAPESDTALAVVLAKHLTSGTATESDAAQSVDLTSGLTAGAATETDSALARPVAKVLVDSALATATETALAPTVTSGLATTAATESDAAVAPTLEKRVTAGVASESATGLAVGVAKTTSTLPSIETSSALSLALHRALSSSAATETDTALAPRFPLTVGVAIETDTALALELTPAVLGPPGTTAWVKSATPGTGAWVKAATPGTGAWAKI